MPWGLIMTTKKQHKKEAIACGGFLRLPQVLALYPVGKTSWYNGIANGRYPKPVKLSERSSAWRMEDIQKLIEETSAAAWAPLNLWHGQSSTQ